MPSSTIHKAAGLTVPGHSMILPGTIPEIPISHEWSRQLERPPDHILYGGRPYGGFVNSATGGVCPGGGEVVCLGGVCSGGVSPTPP